MNSQDLSIIIPVGSKDLSWQNLAHQAALIPSDCEILLVGCENLSDEGQLLLDKWKQTHSDTHWLVSAPGRAKQLNYGAHKASRLHLWFLHSDSRIDSQTIPGLLNSVRAYPYALHYFNLIFSNDGPPLVCLNQAGAWFRSHILGIPFGDQAFGISKENFDQIGQFREDIVCGEDHYFVWAARKRAIPLICVGLPLVTSARKYTEKGWAKTTAAHLRYTFQQIVDNLT